MILILTISIFCQADGFKHHRVVKAKESYIMKVVHDYESRRAFRDCLVTLTMSPDDTKKAAEKWRKR